jgi:hypothetical protein
MFPGISTQVQLERNSHRGSHQLTQESPRRNHNWIGALEAVGVFESLLYRDLKSMTGLTSRLGLE